VLRAHCTNTSANELRIVGEKRLLASLYSHTYGLSSAGAVPHLGQGHGCVVEHWEDITSQETVRYLLGTHGSHLIGFEFILGAKIGCKGNATPRGICPAYRFNRENSLLPKQIWKRKNSRLTLTGKKRLSRKFIFAFFCPAYRSSPVYENIYCYRTVSLEWMGCMP